MTYSAFSFLDTRDLALNDVEALFLETKRIKSQFLKTREFGTQFSGRPVIGMLFFEASTRTRLSFEIAVQRLGGTTLFFDGASKEGTSLIKGESFDDTFWTLHAMAPDAIIVRCGEELDLLKLRDQVKIPLINAGFGAKSHPTQALLDVFTMIEYFPSLKNKQVLFAGDVAHSRVAHSHMELLPRFGAKVGVVGPESLLNGVPAGVEKFSKLEEGLAWADVYVGLRVQFERHAQEELFSRQDFITRYQLKKEHGKFLKKDALVFHPGPVNWGVEFDPDVRELPHFKMWEQKQNGVFIRAAVLKLIQAKNGGAYVA